MTNEIGPEHVEAAYQRLFGRPVSPPRGMRAAEVAQLAVSGYLIYNIATISGTFQKAALAVLLLVMGLSLGVLFERYR